MSSPNITDEMVNEYLEHQRRDKSDIDKISCIEGFVYYNLLIQLYKVTLMLDYLSVDINHTSGSITMN